MRDNELHALRRVRLQISLQKFQLLWRKLVGPTVVENRRNWTCQIQSFGKTHVASGSTKAEALAKVIKACSDATNAIHCSDSDAKCGNE